MSALRRTILDNLLIQGVSCTDKIRIPLSSLLAVTLFARTFSGGGENYTIWLQGSNNGNVWYDLIADLVNESSNVEAPGIRRNDVRDICDALDETDPDQHIAHYHHVAWEYIRVMYALTGSSTLTLKINIVAK